MGAQSAGLHENADVLGAETIDRHRAIASLMEELEAVDWYDQRVQATQNEELKAILAHNRDEEKEHAMMVLEWLRRRDPSLDEHMRNYLFIDKPIVAKEQQLESNSGSSQEASGAIDGSLGIGSLRKDPRP